MQHMNWFEKAMQGVVGAEMAPVFPWFSQMNACAHDPIHHAEGSPWVHTEMVSAALTSDPFLKSISRRRREVLMVSAWAHDIGKPATTILEPEGDIIRVRQPGHASLGARMVWQDLIDRGAGADLAREVHALVAWHMRPSHMHKEREDKILERVIRFSVEAGRGGWGELMALCRADQNGRIVLGSDHDKMLPLELVDLELDKISEREGVDIRRSPWAFGSDSARLKFLRSGESTHYTPRGPEGSNVIIMSGLPGSGKDSWIRDNRPDTPVVSLDEIRSILKVSPEKNQGEVIQAGLNAARSHLRNREDFIWNATNVGKFGRQKITSLCLDYDAHVTFVSMDVPLQEVLRRNSGRDLAVPEKVIRDLSLKREPVLPDEAHSLVSVDQEGMEWTVFGSGRTSERLPSPEI